MSEALPAAADFLVEIGTEELPPKALPALEEAFAVAVGRGLEAAGLSSESRESFASPRRLAVLVRDLQLHQPSRLTEKRGPPLKLAFDADGQPTRAAEAFAAGCGVALQDLERLETEKGAWLLHRVNQPGQPARELLPGIINEALGALPIPKRMRWGAGTAEFVRPVHWVVMLLGSEVVPAVVLGVEAGAMTRGHRFHAPAPVALPAAGDYERVLQEHCRVIPRFSARRARIRDLAVAAARSVNGDAILEADVLDEVTALVEWPAAVPGQFDGEFLRLPEEVLASTMQEHQRYFPVRGTDGKLMPHFIAITNLDSLEPGQVRAGNERVVRPRLADAAFFWDQDCRVPLADRCDSLKSVIFEKQLGSLHDKSVRVAELGQRVAGELPGDHGHERDVLRQWVVRAAHLAKTDLMTAMVGEFPELQGRMGYYYALHHKEHAEVAHALEEQYMPRHAGDRVPQHDTGRALGIADRLDTLAGIFAIGKRPTGNKDPYALRRTALGLLRILIEDGIDLDLPAYLDRALALQPVAVPDRDQQCVALFDFIIERLRAYYLDGQSPNFEAGEISAEMFEAVRTRSPSSPLDFHQRLMAVHAFLGLDAAEALARANKRIANILRGAETAPDGEPEPSLFEAAAESALYDALNALEADHRDHLARRDYAAALAGLARLKEPVDTFFDAVMVMDEDLAKRRNRLALLGRLRRLFLDIADLSQLPGT
jgi:glycyl-tRNA synthetase beta chain